MMSTNRDDVRTIRIAEAGTVPRGALWLPHAGDEMNDLLDDVVPDGARTRVQSEAFQILGRCLGPETQGERRTGLVVGLVQSGKTLSFTSVAALGRDNEFQLVILVAGTNNLLLGQSRRRLRRDLRLSENSAYDRWRRIDVDTSIPVASVADRLASCAADWRDDRIPPSDRATALVTVLKNWQDLRHLTDALARVDLRGMTALVIDDEADQASLNSRVRQGLESATHSELRQLRQALPKHTLLQYTATPQAPLLISMADSLSPDFCFVLAPGDDYVGGEHLFFEDSPYVRILTDADADSDGIAPPAGLVKAMLSFFVGTAAARLEKPRVANRSMLIHPSRRIEPHQMYRNWVMKIKQNWEELLGRPDDDDDRRALLRMFDTERQDLLRTVPAIPELSELSSTLRTVIRRSQVEVLNADPQGTGIREIPWSDEYAWILIGGQLLDRGFTVEGLTTTYMSRAIGAGNADTLWQRARFCGYRGSYRNYIRLFIDQPTQDAFRAYVDHEGHMRRQLADLVEKNEPLREWRRRFLLDRRLRATRAQVLRTLPRRVTVSNGWLEQKFPHHISRSRADDNWKLIEGVLANLNMQPDPGHPKRTPGQSHLVGRISIGRLFDELLSQYALEDEADAMRFSGLDCQLGLYLDRAESETEFATVYLMRQGHESGRKLDEADAVDQLFQGASVEDPAIYRGDFRLHEDGLTMQIYRLEVHDERGRSLGSNLPTLAVWVPQRMAADVIVQPEEDTE